MLKNFTLQASAAAFLLSAVPAFQSVHAQGFELEEVVVTARKREESLQDTPVAVSAFTGEDLALRQISSTDKLGEITPNLTFDPVAPSSGMSSSSQIYIRGVGQSDFTMVTDPGVGLYIDGVYMSRSVGGILDFLDVDRIEVLRGPQGTLFGRNNIGGAVAIYTKRPEEELGGNVKVELGNDDKVFVNGTINVPLSDKLLSSLSMSRRVRDGYVTRVADGIDLGNDDTWGLHGALLFNPTENFEAFVTFDYNKEDENGAPAVSGGINDLQAFPAIDNFINPACPGVAPPPPLRDSMGNPNCLNETAFLGEFTSGGTFPVKSEMEAWGVNATLSWDVNEWLTIKSITSYRDTEAFSSRDGDGSPGPIFHTEDIWDHNQFTQELQFSGRLMEDKLQWLFGFYYFEEDGLNLNPVAINVEKLGSGGSVENDSLAIFGQSTYDLTDKLSLTFGIRYTEDTKRFTPDQIIVGAVDANIPLAALPPPCRVPNTSCGPTGALAIGQRILPFQQFKNDFSDTSVMANIAYEWTDNLMTYATYSEGFKSGGFDQRFAAPPIDAGTGLPTNAPDDFDPESVKSYEIGLKTDMFDSKLRFNAAFFFTDFKDIQLIIRETFNPITFNGGTADILGFELETVWVPTPNWFITGSVGYLDAEYKSLTAAVQNNATPILIDNRLPNSSKWSTSASAAYEFNLEGWGTLTPRVDWSYRSSQFNDAVNTIQLRSAPYHLLNAALIFRTTDERWESVLSFRNITDEKYLVTGNSAFATSPGYLEQVYGRPFEWGWSLQYNFF